MVTLRALPTGKRNRYGPSRGAAGIKKIEKQGFSRKRKKRFDRKESEQRETGFAFAVGKVKAMLSGKGRMTGEEEACEETRYGTHSSFICCLLK